MSTDSFPVALGAWAASEEPDTPFAVRPVVSPEEAIAYDGPEFVEVPTDSEPV